MKFFEVASSGLPSIGLAFGPCSLGFLERWPGLVDYIEVPFELLRHDPSTASIQEKTPVILHCASLSIAGSVRPTDATVAAIAEAAVRTRTPWVGEHLAYLSADPLEEGADEHDVTTLSYTICPQMSEESVDRASRNFERHQALLNIPIILENSPQYFPVPGSTMSIVDFVIEVHSRCRAGMLLDLTHFLISALNARFDPNAEIGRLPLERVVEIHISGCDIQRGRAWDDHANPAGEEVFHLLERTLERAQPQAITFEYNWASDMPDDVVVEQIRRVRHVVGAA
jgi:uncharacterized protein